MWKLEKESIWINQSIYKCTKKLYTLYKEGAIFFYFLISHQSVLLWEGLFFFSFFFFSQSRLAEVSQAPQVLRKKKSFFFLTEFVVDRHCCNLQGTKNKRAVEFISLLTNEATTTITTQPQTFVNCMQKQKSRLYHYFEFVYVKVIFLHVDCCYFVFQGKNVVCFFFLFVKKI